jgi:Flp pilus assembly protein TadD
MGLVYQQQGLRREAIAAMRQAVNVSGGSTEALAGLAQSHAAAGDVATATQILRELSESKSRYVSPYNIARVYSSMDDAELTFEWLERAYEEHNPDLIELMREPSFQRLRKRAEFRRLTRKIGWTE